MTSSEAGWAQGRKVSTVILLLCDSLDGNGFSFANDLLHFGTHTALITVCFVL